MGESLEFNVVLGGGGFVGRFSWRLPVAGIIPMQCLNCCNPRCNCYKKRQ